MDFDKQIAELEAKETKLAEEKNKIKEDALKRVKDLIKLFKFTASEVFDTVKPAKPTKPTTTDSNNYSGFEAGKFYGEGDKKYKFGAKGQKPKWFKELVKAGKKAEELLKE